MRTGHRQPLIYGSAQNDQYGRQRAAFITDLGGDKLSIDFCTSHVNTKNEREYTWHHNEFSSDFVLTLRDVGCLPPQSLKESVEVVKKSQ